ncbi:unnamed protein product [Effrenium voratum]|uniref:RING-type E3 ubiquitin transferase n=1 Tax=Effrenium voratum TaxID=2562239 RepID=A0AA36J4E8_9DINO|nr:unnamed protein product [Effrenium voratum]CAJ1398879.1 unnamed protein product [Effrenium voratum]CAJ1452987.1 unnamed protein product [Effrenium voratum]
MYECNICFESASEPVVTRCGHLFCWKCLHLWLSAPRRSSLGNLQPSNGWSSCPVCKAAVSQQTVTPVYARDGSGTEEAPRDGNLPPRPPGEWQEPETSEAEAFAYGGTAARYSFSAGYGQFPVVCALALASYGRPPVTRRAAVIFGALTLVAVTSIVLI